jgi:predicted O-methyltransferase YrrM
MTDYKFTQDWFEWAPAVWEQLIPLLPERKAFLEIGSFEGRSAIWIMEHMMEDGGYIHCVDTWEGGEEHSEEDMGSVEERFDHNMLTFSGRLPLRHFTKFKETSDWYLANRHVGTFGGHIFDFIYIDGSHQAPDVLTDACMAWPLLKSKGLMVFDDYMWGNPRDALHRPKIAIDAFTNIFGETAEIIHVGYQLVVRKK